MSRVVGCWSLVAGRWSLVGAGRRPTGCPSPISDQRPTRSAATVSRYPLFIGMRYLRAKRREGFISLITFIATGGVAIGVMTLNVVLAVMTGFEEDLRDRILAFTPHVLVTAYTASMPDDRTLLDRLTAVPDVVAAAPYVQGQAMLSNST